MTDLRKNCKSAPHWWGREVSTQFAQQFVSAVIAPPLVGCVVWSHIDSLILFNRLTIFAHRDITVETRLQYELTPFPLSMFSNRDQKMKALTYPLDLNDEPCFTLGIDGGWIFYMVKWEHQTRHEIDNSYLGYVQCLGLWSLVADRQKITTTSGVADSTGYS